MLLFADATDLATFAKKHEVGVGTVSNWMDRWAKEGNTPIKPIGKFGNTQAYSIIDLENLTVYKRNKGPKTVKIEQHNEVIEHRDRLATENAFILAHLRSLGFDLRHTEGGELFIDVANEFMQIENEDVPEPVGTNEV